MRGGTGGLQMSWGEGEPTFPPHGRRARSRVKGRLSAAPAPALLPPCRETRMRILVADDNFAFRQQLVEDLGRWGYEVLVAEDGLTAWRLLQEADAPTLALLDWMMPGMDGARVCEEVRRKPGGRYRYLILLTARADKSDVIRGLEAG